MFWFKKKDNDDNRITFREWYDKHYKENAVFTVIVKPTCYKLSFKISYRDYKLDYETIAKYGDRKVVHEFLVVTRRCANEWFVVLGGK